MDRAIHAASAQEGAIGGIEDRIRRTMGDVATLNVPAGGTEDHDATLLIEFPRRATLENPKKFLLLLLVFLRIRLARLFF